LSVEDCGEEKLREVKMPYEIELRRGPPEHTEDVDFCVEGRTALLRQSDFECPQTCKSGRRSVFSLLAKPESGIVRAYGPVDADPLHASANALMLFKSAGSRWW